MSDKPLLDWVPPYPRGPGHRDQDTSRESAALLAPDYGLLQQKILAVLTEPLTDWEIAAALKLPFENVQPARSGLSAAGKVKFAGSYGESPRSRRRVKKWAKT